MSDNVHWSRDPYWLEGLAYVDQLRDRGSDRVVLDLDAIETVVFNGDGPAYKLLEAMVSISEQESEDGFRGAPRVVLGLLGHLASLSREISSSEVEESSSEAE